MDEGLFKAMFDFFKNLDVVCLRCGECCYPWEVHQVPGYEKGIKPEREVCLHCEQAKLDEAGQWQIACCKIHGKENYPGDCGEFKMPGPLSGGKSVCSLGVGIWKARLEQFLDSKLPEQVREVLGLLPE